MVFTGQEHALGFYTLLSSSVRNSIPKRDNAHAYVFLKREQVLAPLILSNGARGIPPVSAYEI